LHSLDRLVDAIYDLLVLKKLCLRNCRHVNCNINDLLGKDCQGNVFVVRTMQNILFGANCFNVFTFNYPVSGLWSSSTIQMYNYKDLYTVRIPLQMLEDK